MIKEAKEKSAIEKGLGWLGKAILRYVAGRLQAQTPNVNSEIVLAIDTATDGVVDRLYEKYPNLTVEQKALVSELSMNVKVEATLKMQGYFAKFVDWLKEKGK